jgi:hypothetical protein
VNPQVLAECVLDVSRAVSGNEYLSYEPGVSYSAGRPVSTMSLKDSTKLKLRAVRDAIGNTLLSTSPAKFQFGLSSESFHKQMLKTMPYAIDPQPSSASVSRRNLTTADCGDDSLSVEFLNRWSVLSAPNKSINEIHSGESLQVLGLNGFITDKSSSHFSEESTIDESREIHSPSVTRRLKDELLPTRISVRDPRSTATSSGSHLAFRLSQPVQRPLSRRYIALPCLHQDETIAEALIGLPSSSQICHSNFNKTITR